MSSCTEIKVIYYVLYHSKKDATSDFQLIELFNDGSQRLRNAKETFKNVLHFLIFFRFYCNLTYSCRLNTELLSI